MSQRYTDYGVTLEIFADTEKVFQLTIIDPETNEVQQLTNTALYSTVDVKIVKPDGSLIVTVPAIYADRPNGLVEFTITPSANMLSNAGNWIGEVEFFNTNSIKIDQQRFNFNILEST